MVGEGIMGGADSPRGESGAGSLQQEVDMRCGRGGIENGERAHRPGRRTPCVVFSSCCT